MKTIPDQNQVNYFDVGNCAQLDTIADILGKGIPPRQVNPKIVITIPAHNEEELIGKCIESIAGQRTVYARGIDWNDFEILILCHNCTDATYETSIGMLSRFPDLKLSVLETKSPEVNNVGAVRRVLMRIASARIANGEGYIAMTDADSVAHPYWLANIFGYIGSEYGLICGQIDIDTAGIPSNALRVLALKKHYDTLWISLKNTIVPDQSNPLPRHANNSGPNMAVRADVYENIGGIDPLGFCEDIAFYDKIVYAGYKVRHCPMTLMTTSGRTVPRAPWGFGAELSTWDGNKDSGLQVEGLEALLERLRIFKLMREYSLSNEQQDLWAAARRSGIEKERLVDCILKFRNDSALMLRLEKDLDSLESWRERYPKIEIQRACQELENYLSLSSETF
ncbi:Glycosyl transferase family 2 [Pricia antarctica]|uniref:Glycosyl transferase family 2 n=1 Tax=Pricia antarctica TaxID=641691 RepID=A0A1G7I6M5_9FLAO|nr:glycosyltransferase family 2 protein [Pricia antarctica]SDF08371.1 Glycosyl transferase family 2 [Pricia antarctica]